MVYLAAYFSPTIIQGLGHGNIQSQLLSVPPWACTYVFLMVIAFFSDRVQHRFLFAIFSLCIAIAGFVVLLKTDHNTHVKYGALFLSASGTISALPIVLCWFSTNGQSNCTQLRCSSSQHILQLRVTGGEPSRLRGKQHSATVSVTT